LARIDRSAILGVIRVVALLAVAATVGRAGDPDSPTTARPADPPVYIFLNSPSDLDALLKRLGTPDFTLTKGAGPALPGDRGQAAEPVPSAVDAVSIRGEVVDDLAHLEIDLGLSAAGRGPRRVPIRLDGQTITSAREKGRDLPLQVAKDGGWLFEVEGDGRHEIQVGLLAPIKPTSEGWRLDLVIPEAASTDVRLDVASAVADALVSGREPVAIEAVDGGRRSRLRANLSPRRKLDLSWRSPPEGGGQAPPLLSAQGDIAVDVDRGALRTSSSWSIRCERGVARTLRFRVDPLDEVLGVVLDRRSIPLESAREASSADLAIALPKPLRPGETASLVLTTRRPLDPGSDPTTLRGFPLAEATSQSGVLAIAQGGEDLWTIGTAGRGLRRIDPKEDLPPDLRARPGTVLAYRFVEQPFELALRVAPAPPWVRVESRTTVSLDPGRARVDTWLDYQVSRGRVYEVQVALPPGLELVSVGPEGTVAASEETDRPAGGTAERSRTLSIRLSPRARDDGAFQVHLNGRQALDPSRPVAVGLLQPREATDRGGRIAVLADRSLVADLDDERRTGPTPVFRPAGSEPPADWPWPRDRSPATWPLALWLRHDIDPGVLPLRLAVHPRSVQSTTRLVAQVDRRRVELRQETVCRVHHGTLARVDIAVPRSLAGRWDVEGDEVATREALGRAPDGDERHRLILARESVDSVTLRFRSRLAWGSGLAADRPTRVELPEIRLLEGTAEPTELRVECASGVRAEAPAQPGWRPRFEDESTAVPAEGGSPRLTLRADGTPPRAAVLMVTAAAKVALPAVVVPRLWLRTTVGTDGWARTSALYRVESRVPGIEVALPDRANWIGAWVDGEPAEDVERGQAPSAARIGLASEGTSAARLVRIEFAHPARSGSDRLEPPRLLGGGVVQQSYWEVRLPWSQALLGVPGGWADENEWYWDRYVWKRRPAWDESALTRWVAGPSPRGGAPDLDQDGRGSYHGYLLGRPGDPTVMRPLVVSRAGLLGTCSGLVLAVGILILLGRPSARLVVALAAALVLLAAVTLEPNVLFQAGQSSLVGLALVVVAALTQRLVELRRPARTRFPESNGLDFAPASASSGRFTAGVGSEESTLIRPRAGTTADHPALAQDGPRAGAIEGSPSGQGA
jgi:hypothetical protein